nr:replication protein A 70 kDa DNA-binding subunit B [Tanacetum cinerariifolium]
DLSPVKDNIKLRVRILRAWLQQLYNNQHLKNIEMIVMDEHVRCVYKMGTEPLNCIFFMATKIYMKMNTKRSKSLDNGVQFVILGTVIAIQEDEGWWYLGCRACRGKVIKSTDYIDLEYEMPKKTGWPNDWWCKKCNAWVALIKLQMRLGQCRCCFSTMRFRLWLVALLINCEKYAKSKSDGSIPTEITNLIGNKYAFKVAVDDYNVKKLLLVFTVLFFSNDQEIINYVLACATPIKDNEATSNTVLTITLLDFVSQTDEYTTPNEKQKTNKCPSRGEPGSESSTGKNKAVEIKKKVALAPTNEVVDTINDHLLNKFLGEEMVYLICDSIDKTECGSAIDEVVFSPEFINGLKFSGCEPGISNENEMVEKYFQDAKLRKRAFIRECGQECAMPTHVYTMKLIEGMGEDANFTRGRWVSTVEYVNAKGGIASGSFGNMKRFCQNEKLVKVVALIKSCMLNELEGKGVDKAIIVGAALIL